MIDLLSATFSHIPCTTINRLIVILIRQSIRQMNPHTIRTIDYWFGRPICFLLTLFRSSFSAKTHRPKKIMFLKFIEQGATVLAYSAIKRATEIAGRENVYFCVFENNRPILDILYIIPSENIIIIREK